MGGIVSGRTYALWNRVSGNRCGEFASLAEVLAAVARTLGKHGPGAIASLVLRYDDGDDGAGDVIVGGAALAALAAGLGETIARAEKWDIVCELAAWDNSAERPSFWVQFVFRYAEREYAYKHEPLRAIGTPPGRTGRRAPELRDWEAP